MKLIRKFWIRFVSESIWSLERLIFYPKLAQTISKTFLSIKDPVIFDVGANRGQSIRFFKRLFPESTIYGFEPSARVFSVLQNNFNDKPKIKLFELALGSIPGESVLFEHPLDETSTMKPPNNNSDWQKTKNRLLLIKRDHQFAEVVVKVTTIDEFCEAKSVSKIDLLKIDVEGFEFEVLKGSNKSLTNGVITAIQIERHLNDLRHDRTPEIREFLQSLGYEITVSIKHSFGNFYEDIYVKKPN